MSQIPSALPPGSQSELRRLLRSLTARSVGWSLFSGTFVLWALSGWVLWAPISAIAGIALARLVLPLIPDTWRSWVAPLVLLSILLALATVVTVWAWLIAIGVIGAVPVLRSFPVWKPAVVLSVVLWTGITGVIVTEYQSAQEQQRIRQDASAQARAKLLPQTPERLVSSLMTLIARNDVQSACFYFSDAAKAQFATTWAAPDCESAMYMVTSQITDRSAYQDVNTYDSVLTRGVRSVVNGCQVSWGLSSFNIGSADPGPKLGMMELHRQMGQGYLITKYQKC